MAGLPCAVHCGHYGDKRQAKRWRSD